MNNLDFDNANATTHVTASGKVVKVLPATKSLHPERDGVTPNHKTMRVAAYCRVSTSQEEQQGSYELQWRYYEKLIKDKPDWELVRIYGDEGKSGTSMKGRTGFLEMLDDARAGQIDCIICKSTSRFGRNASEFMKTLDELESYGVEVFFEAEGLLTSSKQSRIIFQMMGATNEHYSNTLSNNVRWSKERNMKEGKATICYGSLLGYRKGANGEPEIVPEEAEIVKRIFNLFISGLSYGEIAKKLNADDIKTKKGKEWIGEGVRRILANEKYTGDVILQKTYKKSYLEKRSQKNTGEKPLIIVKNNHEAIIDHDTFAKAAELMNERKKRKIRGASKSVFTGKLICADCGEYYGHKLWKSRGNITYSIWACNYKYSEETTFSKKSCKSANLRDEWIQQGYLYAINQFLATKSEILAKYERKSIRISRKLRPEIMEAKIREAEEIIRQTEEARKLLAEEWEVTYGKDDDFEKRQNELKTKMEEAFKTKHNLEEEQNNLRARKREIERFIEVFKDLPDHHTNSFDENAFIGTVDRIVVKNETMTFYFYGDEHIRVPLAEVK